MSLKNIAHDHCRIAGFLACSSDHRWILGTSNEARRLAQRLPVAGFIDDFRTDCTVDRLPVKRLEELTISDWAVNASMCISPMKAEIRLMEVLGDRFIRYFELSAVLKDLWPVPDFVQDSICSFKLFENKWKWLPTIFSDETSKIVLDALIRFRSTADYTKIADLKSSDQYFDGTLNAFPWLQPGCTFFDCGGYGGETTLDFLSRNPQYEKVYFFEPSSESINAARKKLGLYQNVFFESGIVGEAAGWAEFDDTGSLSSRVQLGTGNFVPVVQLDAFPVTSTSYIKMDIEGYEMRALLGARDSIMRHGPPMAIAVYHCANDFWSIPEFILQLRSDYKCFLRHYTEGWADSVMYFTR